MHECCTDDFGFTQTGESEKNPLATIGWFNEDIAQAMATNSSALIKWTSRG
jgi:hypothetical protein